MVGQYVSMSFCLPSDLVVVVVAGVRCVGIPRETESEGRGGFLSEDAVDRC